MPVLLPDWAPGIHPLIVHFPLVLPFVAIVVDLLGLSVRTLRYTARQAATALYTVAALAALVALFTGQDAADGALLTPAAERVLADHAMWAQRTVWFLFLYAAARVACEWWGRRASLLVSSAIGLLVLFMLAQTGEKGAQLVYEHGVGVAAVAPVNAQEHRHEDHETTAIESDGHGDHDH